MTRDEYIQAQYVWTDDQVVLLADSDEDDEPDADEPEPTP